MCTRVTYLGPDDLVITARSMDWFEDMHTDLWAFPRGMVRDGAVVLGRVAESPAGVEVDRGLPHRIAHPFTVHILAPLSRR